LVPAVEPLVNFACNVSAKGHLSGSLGVPMDGVIALRPYGEQLYPDSGEHYS
jgi:hypothetical protein